MAREILELSRPDERELLGAAKAPPCELPRLASAQADQARADEEHGRQAAFVQ
jgi:hypothetical protein